MYEFPVLWGIPQGFNQGAFVFAVAWAAMSVGGCVAFLGALVAERKQRPAAQVQSSQAAASDATLEHAA